MIRIKLSDITVNIFNCFEMRIVAAKWIKTRSNSCVSRGLNNVTGYSFKWDKTRGGHSWGCHKLFTLLFLWQGGTGFCKIINGLLHAASFLGALGLEVCVPLTVFTFISRKQNVSFYFRPFVYIQDCEESLWPRGSVLDLMVRHFNHVSGGKLH